MFDMSRPALGLQAVEGALDSGALEPRSSTRLAELQMPTLVVVGELDQPDMMRIGEHLAREIPNARLIAMAGVAHLPPMEAPAAFIDTVLPFLEG
jgi:pimeloyl-ACP methyl ester carboxylesterase